MTTSRQILDAYEREHHEEMKALASVAIEPFSSSYIPSPFNPHGMAVMIVGTDNPTCAEAFKTLKSLGYNNLISEEVGYKALEHIKAALDREGEQKDNSMTLFSDSSNAIDLVLAPMLIQDMKGLDFAQKLSEICREHGRNAIRTVPIVLLSSSDGVGSVERVVAEGADELLTAPYTKELLDYRVTTLLKSVYASRVGDAAVTECSGLAKAGQSIAHDIVAFKHSSICFKKSLDSTLAISEDLKNKLDSAQQELVESKAKLSRGGSNKETPSRRAIAHAEEGQKASVDETVRLSQQVDGLRGRVAQLESEVNAVREENAELLDQIDQSERAIATAEENAANAIADSADSATRASDMKEKMEASNAMAENYMDELQRMRSAMDDLQKSHKQLEKRAAELSKQKIQLMRSAVVHRSQSSAQESEGSGQGIVRSGSEMHIPSISSPRSESLGMFLESPRSATPTQRPVSPHGIDDDQMVPTDFVKRLTGINDETRAWLISQLARNGGCEVGIQTDVFELPDDDAGGTHVHYYAMTGNIDDLVSLITICHKLNMPVDVGARTQSNGRSPLHLIGYSGLDAKVERRLAQLKEAAVADVAATASAGKLKPAARRSRASPAAVQREFRARRMKDNEQIIELLVTDGADPSALDANHETPLHIAVHELDIATAKVLLKHGANPDIVDAMGRTPLYLLCSGESTSYVPVTTPIRPGTDQPTNSIEQEPLGVPELTAALLQAGADPHRAANNGVTPHEAARRRDTKPLLTLLRKHTVRRDDMQKTETVQSQPSSGNIDGVTVLPLPLAPGVKLSRDILPKRVSPLWQWTFEAVSIGTPDEMASTAVDLFQALGVCDVFRIPLRTLTRCLKGLPPRGYHSSTDEGPGDRDVGLHNDFSIALSTLQGVFLLLARYGGLIHLASTDALAMCVAAVFYRANRPRFSNGFQIESETELSAQYNEQHILENNAIDFTFEYLSDPDLNIFSHMSEQSFRETRSTIVDLIIASDPIMTPVISLQLENRLMKLQARPWSCEDKEDRVLLSRALFHMAVFSNPLRKIPFSKRLVEAVYNENVAEGEMMRHELGIEPAEELRRSPAGMAKLALTNIDDLLMPLSEHLSVLLPPGQELVEGLRMERLKWLSEQEEMVKAWQQREEKKKMYADRLKRLQSEKEERDRERARRSKPIIETKTEEPEFLPPLAGSLTLLGRSDPLNSTWSAGDDPFDAEVAQVQMVAARDRRRTPHHPTRPATAVGSSRIGAYSLKRSKTVLGNVGENTNNPNTRVKIPPPERKLRRSVSGHNEKDALADAGLAGPRRKVRPKTSLGSYKRGRKYTRNLMLLSQEMEQKERTALLDSDVERSRRKIEAWGSGPKMKKTSKHAHRGIHHSVSGGYDDQLYVDGGRL